MEKKHVVADIEIIREGMDGTHMYVLEKGQVQVSKGTGANKESVAVLQQGNFIINAKLCATPILRILVWRTCHSLQLSPHGHNHHQKRRNPVGHRAHHFPNSRPISRSLKGPRTIRHAPLGQRSQQNARG